MMQHHSKSCGLDIDLSESVIWSHTYMFFPTASELDPTWIVLILSNNPFLNFYYKNVKSSRRC